jgi:cytochrome oxidase Cu insertion factor (SCO1/SenC/PrrC family)
MRKRVFRDVVLALGVAVLGLLWGAVSAQQADPGAAAAPAGGDEKERNYFTDLPVVTQNGETLRFYSDVLKDEVVLISFIFTNCQDACPLITSKLVQTRTVLGEGMADKVRFISLSVDPERDTPEAMKKFAEKLGADQPNWLFLTGEKGNLETIVKRLGQYNDEVDAHSTLLIAGNVKEKHWAKIPPTVPPPGIAMRLRDLAGDI